MQIVNINRIHTTASDNMIENKVPYLLRAKITFHLIFMSSCDRNKLKELKRTDNTSLTVGTFSGLHPESRKRRIARLALRTRLQWETMELIGRNKGNALAISLKRATGIRWETFISATTTSKMNAERSREEKEVEICRQRRGKQGFQLWCTGERKQLPLTR